jgi:hypothetical protein
VEIAELIGSSSLSAGARQRPDWSGGRFTELDDLVYGVPKLFESRQGNDDRITSTCDLFGDSQESSAGILRQVKGDTLTLNLNAPV